MSKKIKKKMKYSINHCAMCAYHASEFDVKDCMECEFGGKKNQKVKPPTKRPRRNEFYE